MRLSVFGLGYVGATSAACFAKLGHKVLGVDIKKTKVNTINNGGTPISIKGLGSLINEQVGKKNLYAITDYKLAILNSDISFVCVETPTQKNGDIDLTSLKKVCNQIGGTLKNMKDYHIVVIRSTIFPGSLNKLENILEESSGSKCGKDFGLVVNPEFLREETAIDDFFDPSYIVTGSKNMMDSRNVMECYKGIKAKKYIVNPEVAQMIKYVNNSWHACKVSFTNEIGAICKEAGVDGDRLMNLFCGDKKLNISQSYHKIGNAYGGHCLSKDLSILQVRSKKLKVNCPLIYSISKSNEIQQQRDKRIDKLKS